VFGHELDFMNGPGIAIHDSGSQLNGHNSAIFEQIRTSAYGSTQPV